MAVETPSRTWITGEEYATEWSRLREAGYHPDSPEVQNLLRRIDERDEYLWQQFGAALQEKHPGKWAAIALTGEVILGDSDLAVSEEADRRLGEYNYYAVGLDERRGAPYVGPRSD